MVSVVAATTLFLTRVEERLQADHGKSIRDYVDFYAGNKHGQYHRPGPGDHQDEHDANQ